MLCTQRHRIRMLSATTNTVFIEQTAWTLHLTRPRKLTYDAANVVVWIDHVMSCLTTAITSHRTQNDVASLKAIRVIIDCTCRTCTECATAYTRKHWDPLVTNMTTNLLEWLINVGQFRLVGIDCETYCMQLRRTIECVCSSLFYCTWFESMRHIKRNWLLDKRYNVDDLQMQSAQCCQNTHLLVLAQLLGRIKDQEFGAKERIDIGIALTRLHSSADLSSLSYNRCNSEQRESTLKRPSSEPQLSRLLDILQSNDPKNSHADENNGSTSKSQSIPHSKKRRLENALSTHSSQQDA